MSQKLLYKKLREIVIDRAFSYIYVYFNLYLVTFFDSLVFIVIVFTYFVHSGIYINGLFLPISVVLFLVDVDLSC